MAIAVAEETVIPDLNKAFGQDVLEEATDELLSSDGAVPGFSRLGVFVAKGPLVILECQDAIGNIEYPVVVGNQDHRYTLFFG